jgi:CBS domain-containing protein
MAKITIDRVDGLCARDVMHAQTSALSPDATLREARDYFAASASRRLAVIADPGGRYLGSLTPADLPDAGDPERPALALAPLRKIVGADDPAATARDLALTTDTRRVPVVGEDGRYLGIVSVDSGQRWFCGTGSG